MSRELKNLLIAGTLVGLLGVALFGLVHAVIIVPIWDMLFGGIPFGLAGGIAMGWAFYELQTPARQATSLLAGLRFGVLLWLTLLPMTVLGAVLRMTGIHGTDDTWETIVECMLAFATGAFTGRAFTGYWRPALALGSATLALMLTMGGPIPVTNSAHATMLLAAFAGIYPLCGLVLAAIGSVLSRVSGPAA